jgi:carboxyl-terminal processing protease
MMSGRLLKNRLRNAIVMTGVVLAACWPAIAVAKPARDATGRFRPSIAADRLVEVLNAVERSNAPNLIGKDKWKNLIFSHGSAIVASRSHTDFARTLNELLHAGGVSHFHYLTDDEWAYWHLVGVFGREGRDVEVEHAGIYPQPIDGRWYVRGVLEGSPAAEADIKVGDELIAVDGEPYVPIASWRGKAGRSVTLTLARREGERFDTTVVPVRESLGTAVRRAMVESVRVIEHEGLRFAYAHAWMLLGEAPMYGRLLELQDDVDGLLLDYRDGVGGTPGPAQRFLLGRGSGGSNAKVWHKPAVILIADGTRSAKELVVHAVRQAGRAPLIGTPTPGNVTAVGRMVHVGTDGFLLIPGFKFPIEGKPTIPDHLIDRRIPHLAGADPQLELAKEIAAQLIVPALGSGR